jgi:N-acetyl-anhydromuramyl-L-alanine amidase AmpD
MIPTIEIVNSHHWSSRGGYLPRAIVLHHTAGTNSLKHLTLNSKGVSTHFLVPKQEKIYRMVPDDKAAHTVGFSNIGVFGIDPTGVQNDKGNANQITLNIEIENLGNGRDRYTDFQYDAVSWICASWWKVWTPLPILSHSLIDTGGKNDPLGWDWLRLYRGIISLS